VAPRYRDGTEARVGDRVTTGTVVGIEPFLVASTATLQDLAGRVGSDVVDVMIRPGVPFSVTRVREADPATLTKVS
jgi:hypothetical protein